MFNQAIARKSVLTSGLVMGALALQPAFAGTETSVVQPSEHHLQTMTSDQKLIDDLLKEMNTMGDSGLNALSPLPIHKFEIPDASVDIMRVRMEETYDVKGIGKDTVQLHGWIAVVHDNPVAVNPEAAVKWGNAITPTRFVGLDLHGDSSVFGPVHVQFDPSQPINGRVGNLHFSMLEQLQLNQSYAKYRQIKGNSATPVMAAERSVEMSSPQSAAISTVLSGVLKGIHNKNGQEIMGYYAPGAQNVYFSSAVPDPKSEQAPAFAQQVSKMFSMFKSISPVADDDLKVNVNGDLAEASVTGHNEVVDAAGETAYNSWKWKVNLRKEGAAWKIINDDMAMVNDPNSPQDTDRVPDACSASTSVTSACKCSASVAVAISMPKLNLDMKVSKPVIWYSEVQSIPPTGATASVSFSPTPLVDDSGRQLATLTHGVVKFREVVRRVSLKGTEPEPLTAQLKK